MDSVSSMEEGELEKTGSEVRSIGSPTSVGPSGSPLNNAGPEPFQSQSESTPVSMPEFGSKDHLSLIQATSTPNDYSRWREGMESLAKEKDLLVDEGIELIRHSPSKCSLPPSTNQKLQFDMETDKDSERKSRLINQHLEQLKVIEVSNDMIKKPLITVPPSEDDPLLTMIVTMINNQTSTLMTELLQYRSLIKEALDCIGKRENDLRRARQSCTCGALEEALKKMNNNAASVERAQMRLNVAAGVNVASVTTHPKIPLKRSHNGDSDAPPAAKKSKLTPPAEMKKTKKDKKAKKAKKAKKTPQRAARTATKTEPVEG